MGEAHRSAPAFLQDLGRSLAASTADPAHALALARARLGQLVGRQALALSFEDVFRQMAWLFLAALVLVPLCRPARAPPPQADSH